MDQILGFEENNKKSCTSYFEYFYFRDAIRSNYELHANDLTDGNGSKNRTPPQTREDVSENSRVVKKMNMKN